MNELIESGVMVIPYSKEIREAFHVEQYLSGQKEYIQATPETVFVMGGFGAFGNPSSFHHPEIRTLRQSIYETTKPMFQQHYAGHYLECLVDRFCIRRPGTSVSAESWHRDISNVRLGEKRGREDDVIYGGWVNLDDANTQYFSCVPYTHTADSLDQGGFSRLSKEDAANYKARSQKIVIPPNHLIIFNEKTVHQVLPVKQEKNSYRLFMKYRISKDPQPLFPDIMNVIEAQGVFPLSLAQVPPMYGKLHAAAWRPQLKSFSQNIKPAFLDSTSSYTRVKRFMPSLQEADMDMFPVYSQPEIDMLRPVLLEESKKRLRPPPEEELSTGADDLAGGNQTKAAKTG